MLVEGVGSEELDEGSRENELSFDTLLLRRLWDMQKEMSRIFISEVDETNLHQSYISRVIGLLILYEIIRVVEAIQGGWRE